MKILAFDTSTIACSAALTLNGVVTERFELAPRRHAELLLSMMQSLLSGADVKLTDLDAIAFGCGPGSFMGIRLAVGVAQGLGFGANRQLIAVSSLQTIAQAAHEQHGMTDVLAGWDARMQQIYWGQFQLDNHGVMSPSGEEALSDPAKVMLDDSAQWFAAGNAWSVYRDSFESSLLDKMTIIDDVIYPRASAMLSIAALKLSQGELLSAQQAQPVYLRHPVYTQPT